MNPDSVSSGKYFQRISLRICIQNFDKLDYLLKTVNEKSNTIVI